jgi:hypothetical protein
MGSLPATIHGRIKGEPAIVDPRRGASYTNGMVLRRRDGIRVKYEATERGIAYLNGLTGAKYEN